MRRSFSLLLTTLTLVLSIPAEAGFLDKAKSLKNDLDKTVNTPTKVSIGKGHLEDNAEDIAKVFAAFKKKIGTHPLMVYGASLGFNNDAHITYQTRYNPEKLETLHFSKNEIQSKPSTFTLRGDNVKVENNVFDLGKVNLSAIPGLVKATREKTTEATKGKNTLGSTVKIVQFWTKGKPTQVRIVVNVAVDDGKSTAALIGDAVDSINGAPIPKGASVGQLTADETGKVIGFRMI